MANKETPKVPDDANVTPKAPKTPASPKAPSASKASTSKSATPKAPSPKAPSAPKAPATPKTPDAKGAAAGAAVNTANATNAPNAPKAPNAPQQNVSVESAKEAELQKVAEGASPVAPQKKKNAKKLIFLLVLLVLVAAIAVTAALVIPNLLNNEQEPDLQLTNPDATGSTEVGELDFVRPVTDYTMGDTIDRGIGIQNTSDVDILVCFKLEIYDEQNGTTPISMDATPTVDRFWRQSNVVETLEDGTQINSVYYYYTNVVESNSAVLPLFSEYIVNADSSTSNSYANGTVYPRVTVQYTVASNEGLDGATEECWQESNLPSGWRASLEL